MDPICKTGLTYVEKEKNMVYCCRYESSQKGGRLELHKLERLLLQAKRRIVTSGMLL